MTLANMLTVVVLCALFVAAVWLGEDSRDGPDWRSRDDQGYEGGRS